MARQDPEECPSCKGRFTEGEAWAVHDVDAVQKRYCTACNASWTAVFIFTHNECIVKGDNDD